MKKIITLFMLISILNSHAQVIDIDGNTYETAIIGNQTWMAENLNVTRFRNGDTIPEAKTNEEWIKAGENNQPAWCYYDNDSSNGTIYGKLYNWSAVYDARGLAPEGWHIPNIDEWDSLRVFLKEDVGQKLKSKNGWHDFDTAMDWEPYMVTGNGWDAVGFNALPAGIRYEDGSSDIYYSGYWWSESPQTDYRFGAYFFYLTNRKREAKISHCSMTHGLSVRCVKD